MKTLKKEIILILMATAMICGVVFGISLLKSRGNAYAEAEFRGTLYAKNNPIDIVEISGEKNNKFTFDYYILEDATVQFCVLNNWADYIDYFTLNKDGLVGTAEGISTEKLADNYIRVTIEKSDLDSALIRLYTVDWRVASNVYLDRVQYVPREFRGTLYAKNNAVQINLNGTTNKLSFDYCIVGEDTVDLCVLNGSWGYIVQYFTLNKNGLSDEVEGITTVKLADGYVRVTISNEDFKDASLIFYSIAGRVRTNIYLDRIQFVSDVFQMMTGASARLALDGHYGVKFIANISEGAFDAEAEYGMIIIPFDYIATYNLDGDYIAQLEEQNVAFRKFTCTPIATLDGYKIQASLTDIKESNLNRKFIGIAFKKVGETYTYVDVNEGDNARSIKTVATRAVMDTKKFNAFNESEKEFLKTTANVVTNLNESSSIVSYTYATNVNATRNQVIEFYYKKLTEGTVRFAVIGSSWANYYGYFSMDNDYSLFNGVQVSPVGTDFEYVSGSDKLNSLDQWYKVVIDIASLDKVNEDEAGSVASQEYFNAIYFSGTTAKLELTGINVRDAVVTDKAYSCYGNNSTTTYSYTFTEAISYENISRLTYYVKAVSNVGGNVLKIQVKGLGEYVNVNTSSLTTNKAYATVETVESGEYDGWLKVTYDFSLKNITSNITGFYTRYNEGEFLVGGFSAEYT